MFKRKQPLTRAERMAQSWSWDKAEVLARSGNDRDHYCASGGFGANRDRRSARDAGLPAPSV